MYAKKDNTVGANIKKQRKLHMLTQKQLADALGVSQSAVYYWETGKREANTETITMLCQFFNISPNELYGLKEISKESEFSKACEWLSRAGYSVIPADENKGNRFRLISNNNSMYEMNQSDIIHCVQSSIKKADRHRDQLVIDFINTSIQQLRNS